jgi:predicted enzyme related to lactoylglutathione lyase
MPGSPQVNVYATDIQRGVAFYRAVGFTETFRTPEEGEPIHVEMVLDGFTLGVVDAREPALSHGYDATLPGRGIEVVLWCDDADAEYARLLRAGATALTAPHDFRTHLRRAWVADPDGNPIQVVAKR